MRVANVTVRVSSSDTDLSMILSTDQITQFRADGFATIPRFVDDYTLDALRAAYDEMIELGAVQDGSLDRRLGGLTRQIMRPECSHPTFRNNPARVAAIEAAGTLAGWTESRFYYSQLLYKPPGHSHATPWHQDEAYGAVPFVPPGTRQPSFMMSFWVALDDVDADNGCMHFYPRTNDQLLAHRVVAGDADDEGRMLGLEDETWMDPDRIVCCSLEAGGATVHDAATLHFTPPNHSTRARRAYIISIAQLSFLQTLPGSEPPRSTPSHRIIRKARALLGGRRA
jgi:Phytanoyl-CoA dioxygenase (PhyH)